MYCTGQSMIWFEQEGWQRVSQGEALDKVHTLIGHDNDEDIWHKKYGRKTVFLRYSGVIRLYVVDDNGVLHNDRCFMVREGLDALVQEFIDRAMKWGKYDVAI